MTKKTIHIITDGACRGNPGPGGWGAVLRYNHHHKTLSGGELDTTNNRMELQAVIMSLRAIKDPCHIIVTTDSKYVQQGITKWLSQWKKRNWKTSHKTPVKNVDLWQTLEKLTHNHDIEWHWVKGHSGHADNEFADELARDAIDTMLKQEKKKK